MRLSLTGVAAANSSKTLADRKLALLALGDVDGLIELNRTQFGAARMEADGDDDADDDTDDDTDGDDETDDDADDDDDEDKGSKKKEDPKAKRIEELTAENKRRRLRARQQAARIRELETQLTSKSTKSKSKSKDGDDSDDDSDDSGNAESAQKVQQLERTNEDLLIRLEFMSNKDFKWKNPKAALKLLNLDDVEITDDGEVDGLEDAIKALADSDPYLLEKSKDGEDDDEDEDGERKTRRRTGQPTGGRKKGQPNRTKLEAKYPALRR